MSHPKNETEDMKLVFVEWLDSFGCSSRWEKFYNFDPAKAKPMTCYSVGWLFHDGEDCKIVIPHISDRNHDDCPQQGCGDMTIPTKAIVRIVTLEDPLDVTAPGDVQ